MIRFSDYRNSTKNKNKEKKYIRFLFQTLVLEQKEEYKKENDLRLLFSLKV